LKNREENKMEERREMNGQRVMTRDELEMRLPALNHIAEQRDAKFRLRYAEKTVNNGIERGYTLDAGTRVSVNVYQNESWVQMPDEELFDTLNDLDGRYCVTEDQETIGERLNALFKSGELFEKIYPVVVSENNKENFAEAGITFDRYLDMLVTYRVELMQMNDGIGTIRLQDSHLETFGISRQKIRKAAFANLEGIVDFMTLRDDASGFKMIAVARKDKQFGGAAAMLLPSVRRRLAEIFGTDSLVFLPSSISEVIAVPQTAGEPEVRAWTIKRGTKAPQAAGKIHTDFERGFIRAEVVSYDDLIACGSHTAAKEKGLIRLEGKDYVVQDGDIMLFRFNV